nr:fibronectin type III domain-containing protein [Paenibacillus jamilae]
MKILLRRIGLLMSAFLCSVIIFSTANTYAASIGSRLETPEDGWERYNDTAKQIKYIGTGWGYSENVSGRYKGDGHHQLGPDISGKVMFKFLGTKLRLMSFVHNEGSFRFAKDVKVTIDGIDKHFNMNLDKQQEQTLVFETSGLENKVHTVEISTVVRTETRGINLDSIDIDKDGELIDIDVPTNLKATPGDSQVTLKWDKIENAESYTVKYGTESGKYNETATATKDAYGNFVIPGLTNGTKYYFVVSAKLNGVDSEYSNEASATPQGGGSQPDPEPTTGDRAILDSHHDNWLREGI